MKRKILELVKNGYENGFYSEKDMRSHITYTGEIAGILGLDGEELEERYDEITAMIGEAMDMIMVAKDVLDMSR